MMENQTLKATCKDCNNTGDVSLFFEEVGVLKAKMSDCQHVLGTVGKLSMESTDKGNVSVKIVPIEQ